MGTVHFSCAFIIPPVRAENYGEIREAIRRTHRNMGMNRPDGGNFRHYPEEKLLPERWQWHIWRSETED
ncbi:PerC family transcriptional regulator [Salmonella enterica]|nr:PerC family transcriptional regulator [Salmonella enterica]EEI9211053.1 PerC family transcriptional regulator [Salmonella enterica subsp. enterica serovar Carrau]EEJ7417056.1 PerC family transcriptional regulator [Salmonella enterica subsp. enterica serovar Sandiego]HCM4642004.1 PerC family transcriptional regulator [Salmonella enterica subsp. enterica serovar Panama]EEK8144567.1 PerC family transcriptional regulator [Salmonella enterica]